MHAVSAPRPRSCWKVERIVSRRLYADASALVKLVIAESETGALSRALLGDVVVVTSSISIVEVTRAVRLAELEDDTEPDPDALLDGCTFVDCNRGVLAAAASLASGSLTTLDAIHLATAIDVAPDAMLVYDRRLARAAASAGLRVEAPGA